MGISRIKFLALFIVYLPIYAVEGQSLNLNECLATLRALSPDSVLVNGEEFETHLLSKPQTIDLEESFAKLGKNDAMLVRVGNHWLLAMDYNPKSQTLSYRDPRVPKQAAGKMSVSENLVTINAEVTNRGLTTPLIKEPIKALVVLKNRPKSREHQGEPKFSLPSFEKSQVKHPKLDYFNSPEAPEQALNREQLEEVRQMLHDVDYLTAGVLKLPEYLGLETTLDAENACYNLDTNFLQVPYWLKGQKHLTPEKVQHLRRALVTHEYGHTLFELNAGKEFRQGIKSLKNQKNALDQVKPRNDSQLSDQTKKHADIQERIFFAEDRFMGLHELFADTLAVLATEDLRVMNDSIQGAVIPKGHKEWAVVRDFALQHQPEEWMSKDSHFYFAPIRSFLGSKNIDKATPEKKKKIISALLKTSQVFALESLENERQLEHRDANKRLLEILKENFPL